MEIISVLFFILLEGQSQSHVIKYSHQINIFIIESQDLLGWIGSLEIIQSYSLLKQGQLEQIVWDCVHLDSEDLQGWRFHNLSGQPVPCLVTLTTKIRFLKFCQNLQCCSQCPLLLVLSVDATEKSLPLLHPPPIRYLYTWVRSL